MWFYPQQKHNFVYEIYSADDKYYRHEKWLLWNTQQVFLCCDICSIICTMTWTWKYRKSQKTCQYTRDVESMIDISWDAVAAYIHSKQYKFFTRNPSVILSCNPRRTLAGFSWGCMVILLAVSFYIQHWFNVSSLMWRWKMVCHDKHFNLKIKWRILYLFKCDTLPFASKVGSPWFRKWTTWM